MRRELHTNRGPLGLARCALILLIGVALIGTACARAEDPSRIKIGLMAAFNGPLAYFGAAYDKATSFFANEVAEQGGIAGGKTIEIVACDTERRSEKEVTCVEKLIKKDKVKAIVADNAEGILSPRALDTINRNRIPVILPAQTVPIDDFSADKAPFLFADVQKRDYGKTLVDFFVDQMGVSRLGLLHATDLYGSEGLKELQQALSERRIEPTTIQSYAAGDQDMTIQATKLRDSGAEAVIIWGLGSDAARAVESMKRIGYKPKIGGPPGLYINTYRNVLGPDSNDTIMAAPHAPGDLPVNIQEVIWLFRFYMRYGFNFFIINGRSAPDWPILELNAYKGIRYLGLAIDRVQSTDGTAIRDVLESGQRFDALGYQVRWSQTSHIAVSDPATETWIARFTDGHVLFDWDPRAPKAYEWCRRDIEEVMTQTRLEEIGRQAGRLIQELVGEILGCFDRYESEFRARMGDTQFQDLKNLLRGIATDPGRARELAENAARQVDPLGRGGTPGPTSAPDILR
jgi:branched-chain amino acid transport system substrate-binding protein